MLPSIKDADVTGRRVLVRADFNVPLDSTGGGPRVADDWRLHTTIPTLELLRERGAAKIIVLSHLGRPGGRVVEELRLAPVERRLRELTDVAFEMHENLRFDPREEGGEESFAEELATLGDLYVNEAFADSHRAHASIVGLPKLLPSFAGLRLVKEVERMREALEPPRPAAALIGGAKFETKEPLLIKLASVYDTVLVGGALGNDILRARGMPVGASFTASRIAPTPLAMGKNVIVPEDVVVEYGGSARVAVTGDVRAQERIVDVGPETVRRWGDEVAGARFILWNGPLGLYEKGYAAGTQALARALARASARSLIGGGDTVAAVRKCSFDAERIFLSTGGGAMLQFLVDGTLPGIEALKKQSTAAH